MKIYSIQQSCMTSFRAKPKKPKFLSQDMKDDLANILVKMNMNLEKSSVGDRSVNAKILSSINSGNSFLYDWRTLVTTLPEKEQMVGNSEIKFGKIDLFVDNSTGEIIDYTKPFYKRWKSVMKELHSVLDNFRKNFNNEEIVNKSFLNVNCFSTNFLKK